MQAEEYHGYDAIGLAELISTGELDPADVLEAAISRIETLNPKYNAVVEKLYDQARRDLANVDPEAPFAGVPILIKDLHTLVAGSRLTQGSAFLKDHVSSHDSDIVARFRKAGFIILGRTNTPEFGLNTTTEGRFHGPARNPWASDRSTGGSSGGAAAAVASGMVPVAHGTDSGGSIRVPASCCGLVGLKPSRGRIFAGLDKGEGWHDLFNSHILSRSVRDTAAILGLLANNDGPAPYHAPSLLAPIYPRQNKDAHKYKIAVMASPPSGVDIASDPLAALTHAQRLCEELGHSTVPLQISLDLKAYAEAFTLIISASVAATVMAEEKASNREAGAEDFEASVWSAIELGRKASAADLNAATATLHLLAQDVKKQLRPYDMVLSPTLATPPPLLGELDASEPDFAGFLGKVFAFAPFTSLFNATGQPAISLPLFWGEQGLPIGVQFAAAQGEEAKLLDLAFSLEAQANFSQQQEKLLR